MAFVVVVGLLAETLQLPQWVLEISPFEHVPAVPAEAFDLGPPAVLLAVAAGLVAIGLTGIGRRDIARR